MSVGGANSIVGLVRFHTAAAEAMEKLVLVILNTTHNEATKVALFKKLVVAPKVQPSSALELEQCMNLAFGLLLEEKEPVRIKLGKTLLSHICFTQPREASCRITSHLLAPMVPNNLFAVRFVVDSILVAN